MPADALTGTAVAILILVGLGIGAFFKFGPGKTLGALADAILGEPAIRDRAGRKIQDERPGLVARTDVLEDAVTKLVDQDARITRLEHGHLQHDAAIAALIASTFEKGAKSALQAEELKNRDIVEGEVEDA